VTALQQQNYTSCKKIIDQLLPVETNIGDGAITVTATVPLPQYRIISQSGELGLIGGTGMVGTIFTVIYQSSSKVTINQLATASNNSAITVTATVPLPQYFVQNML